MTTHTTLFVVTNEDGNVTADADRQTAINRMLEQYGGSNLNVMDVAIPVKRPNEYLQSITVRPEMDDDRYVHKA